VTTEPGPRSRIRLALTAFPARYGLPARPPQADPLVQDAYRQTQFLLGEELAVFGRAMNLQLAIVAANAKLRTAPATALFGLWSRTYLYLSDVCELMAAGSYATCAPVLRTACDCLAAQRSLIADGFAEYQEWLARATGQAKEHAAMAMDLGRFRSGSVLAADQRLGGLYRLLTDFSMPNFGSTTLQTAPDSGLQRIATAFGSGGFHLGWAELVVGWLLLLGHEQLATVVSSGVLRIEGEQLSEHSGLVRELSDAIEDPRRCRAEVAGDRFLIRNWRRAASGAPKRILL